MRKLLLALLVLALVVIGADVGGRLYAQNRAEHALAQRLPGDVTPTVRIHGFSFLLQALAGSYSHVTVRASDLGVGSLGSVSASAELHDVDYPLRDAVDGRVEDLAAGRAELRTVIPAHELATALGLPDLILSSTGGSSGIRVRTSVSVAGKTFPVTADVAASVHDGALHLSGSRVSAADAHLPSAVATKLERRLMTSVPIPRLPFSVTSAEVSVSDGQLVVTAAATDLKFDQNGAADS